MIDTRSEFLTTILAAPEDDTCRKVFADWLEENGEPERAEFIRVQCELAKPWSEDSGECWQCRCQRIGAQHTNGKCKCTERWRSLRRRERELLMRMGHRYVPKIGIAGVFGYDALELNWSMGGSIVGKLSRGFIEHITCTWADWLAHHAAIQAVTPLLREVTLMTRPDDDWLVQHARKHKILMANDMGESILNAEWPDITFHLPTANARWAYSTTEWRPALA